MTIRTQTLLTLFGIIAVALVFWVQSLQFHYPDGVFPKGVILLLGGLGIVNVVAELCKPAGTPSTGDSAATAVSRPIWYRTPLFVGLTSTVVYFLAISLIGFYGATFFFLAGMYGFRDGTTRRWALRPTLVSLASAGGLSVLLYIVFTVLLGVQTPQGYL